MIQVGMDIRMIHNTGIGTYLKGLILHFNKKNMEGRVDLTLYGDVRRPDNLLLYPRKKFRSKIYSIQEQIEYPSKLQQCQLWHSPHYNVPILKGNCRLVVTIHDIIHWIFRKELLSPLKSIYAGAMLKKAVRQADQIITVSEKTKEDLVHHFDADAEKITVVYEGVDSKFQPAGQEQIRVVQKEYDLPEKYFFYVGMLKPHKQVHKLIRDYRFLRKEGKTHAGLVIVGKKDKTYPQGYEELRDLKTGEGIIYLDYVSDEELIALYSGALAIVHPSIYEGFGLTLLESMACETPVLACRAASIPEVVGDAAHLFDPTDAHGLLKGMQEIEMNEQYQLDLKSKGKKNLQRFSWEKAAAKTLSVYEKALK